MAFDSNDCGVYLQYPAVGPGSADKWLQRSGMPTHHALLCEDRPELPGVVDILWSAGGAVHQTGAGKQKCHQRGACEQPHYGQSE